MIKLWIPSVEAVLVLFVTCFLIRKYADLKRTNNFSVAMTSISWFLAFSIIFFIPLDIYLTSAKQETSEFLVGWWYFYYWTSFFLSMVLLPILIGYLEAADFTLRGRMISAIKYNIPFYLCYLVLFVGLVCFLYFSKAGQSSLEQGGGLIGVLMGLNITAGLCQLALTLGYGMVRIPINTFKSCSLEKRYQYAVFKVAKYEDDILELLYERTNCIQSLLYLINNMNVEESLRHHVDEMHSMIDRTLGKTDEEALKERAVGQRDVETVLVEEFNNGWIDITRL